MQRVNDINRSPCAPALLSRTGFLFRLALPAGDRLGSGGTAAARDLTEQQPPREGHVSGPVISTQVLEWTLVASLESQFYS